KNTIIEGSTIMPGAVIKDNAIVRYSIIGQDAVVEENAVVGNTQREPVKGEWQITVVGPNVTIKKGTIVPVNAMIGEEDKQ
ncbi:MAG: glucose-1-phosphate adenylyltransferase, partial [Clostridia bacterium]